MIGERLSLQHVDHKYVYLILKKFVNLQMNEVVSSSLKTNNIVKRDPY